MSISTYAADINLKVKGLESGDGQLIIYLYNDSDAFPTKPEKAYKKYFSEIKDKSSSIVLKDIPVGVYAIAVVHDEDKDSELDTNFLGMPSEDVAASNNAKGSFGPPKFKDAAFKVTEKNIELLIDFSL
jgi:uncharacterized protein (DUF2141 family)